MRITGGILKGRVIKCPDGVIRPAMDKMRESVFAILGDLSGKSWLDLFSGSGTIAIEAASRGAGEVSLCEKDKVKMSDLQGYMDFKNYEATAYQDFVAKRGGSPCPSAGGLHLYGRL